MTVHVELLLNLDSGQEGLFRLLGMNYLGEGDMQSSAYATRGLEGAAEGLRNCDEDDIPSSQLSTPTNVLTRYWPRAPAEGKEGRVLLFTTSLSASNLSA